MKILLSLSPTTAWLLKIFWQKGCKKNLWRFILAIACIISGKIITIALAFIYQQVIDNLSSRTTLLIFPLGLIVLYGVTQFFIPLLQDLREIIFQPVLQQIIQQLLIKCQQQFFSAPYEVHVNKHTAHVITQIQRGLAATEMVINTFLFTLLPCFLEFIIIFCIMFVKLSHDFFWLVMSGCLVYFLFNLFTSYSLYKMRLKVNFLLSTVNQTMLENFSQIETVMLFNQQLKERLKTKKQFNDYQQQLFTIKKKQVIINTIRQLIFIVTMITSMLITALHVVTHQASLGDFILINILLMQAYMPVTLMTSLYQQTKQAMADLKNLHDHLFYSNSIDKNKLAKNDEPLVKMLRRPLGNIVFTKVDFSYDGRRKVLDQLNFQIHAGEIVCILGKNGSGKSTLIKLLLGFCRAHAGEITLDGINITKLSPHDLRQHIGLVTQEQHFFDDSITYNIAYGKPTATHEEIVNVAKMVELHDFILSLPEQYDTLIGERGIKLSGGQKQRLCLARVLLRDSPILVLDEATASLDPLTEHEILQMLKKIAIRKTLIFITHNRAMSHFADQVFIMREGNIHESNIASINNILKNSQEFICRKLVSLNMP